MCLSFVKDKDLVWPPSDLCTAGSVTAGIQEKSKRKKPQNKTKNINPETRPILLINMAEIKSEEEACLLYIILPQAGDKLQSIRCLAVCLCAFLYIRYAIFLKKWPKIGIDTQT